MIYIVKPFITLLIRYITVYTKVKNCFSIVISTSAFSIKMDPKTGSGGLESDVLNAFMISNKEDTWQNWSDTQIKTARRNIARR